MLIDTFTRLHSNVFRLIELECNRFNEYIRGQTSVFEGNRVKMSQVTRYSSTRHENDRSHFQTRNVWMFGICVSNCLFIHIVSVCGEPKMHAHILDDRQPTQGRSSHNSESLEHFSSEDKSQTIGICSNFCLRPRFCVCTVRWTWTVHTTHVLVLLYPFSYLSSGAWNGVHEINVGVGYHYFLCTAHPPTGTHTYEVYTPWCCTR